MTPADYGCPKMTDIFSNQKILNFAPCMNASPKYLQLLRKSALIMLVLAGSHLHAQFDCSILQGDTTVCYGQSVYLFTAYSDTLNYSWEPNGETGVIIEVEVTDTVTYILNVYNDDSTFHCTDSVTLSVFPRIIVEFEQLVFGCPPSDSTQSDSICKAQVKANATGGYPPYHFNWGDSILVNYTDSSWALNLCVDQTYTLVVYDTVCSYSEQYDVESFEMPDIIVTVEPDSLFITNPQAVLSFENKSADSIPITSWTWIFPTGYSTNELSPSYVFVQSDSIVKFTYTTIDNCNDTIIIPILVKDFELEIPNVFTPNGDGVNDSYVIPYLDRYISTELYVFNRWGELVYKGANYSGGWDGGKLPDGVYFYVLKCQGYWEEFVYKGSVSIYGSQH
jgi:gliding motility-associated-like protein